METPLQAFKRMEREIDQVIADESLTLYDGLVATAPVYQYNGPIKSKQRQGGHFKRSYNLSRLTAKHWRISNNASYADVLARGRRYVGDRYYGSLQWRAGLAPMLMKTDANLTRRFKTIKG